MTSERRISPRELPDDRVSSSVRATRVGAGLAHFAKNVRKVQMPVFTGAEIHKQGFHVNLEIADEVGLKDCIAQGMLDPCWASELRIRSFGMAFLTNGHHYTTHFSSIYPNDSITCPGWVAHMKLMPGGQRVEVEY